MDVDQINAVADFMHRIAEAIEVIGESSVYGTQLMLGLALYFGGDDGVALDTA